MKQEQFETVISLKKAFLHPRGKRIRKALNEIKRFVKKHAKNTDIVISTDVNQALHANSINIPRKINVILVKHDNTVKVYLKESKQLEEDIKKRQAIEKEKKDKKDKDKKEKTDDKKDEEKEPEEKKKLEQKREKEKATKSLEMKTGRK